MAAGHARVVLALSAGLSLAGLALWASSAEEAPRLRSLEGRLHLAELPSILDSAEVREPLASGLTTSFVFDVTARDGAGGKVQGGALVEIRFDLWDEVYLASLLGADGVRRHTTLAGRGELVEWWRSLDLEVADARPLARGSPWQARVRLSVLPFSSAEQRDAQRWFSRSLEGGRTPANGPELSDVLNVLIATSIARESAVVFDWRLAVSVAGTGGGGG